MHKRFLYLTGLILFIGILFVLSFLFADYVKESELAKDIVQKFGYLGILIIAIIGGFNLFIPIPVAVFTPIFLASDLPVFGIIITLAVGSTLADILGYIIGIWGQRSWNVEEKPFFKKIQHVCEKYRLFLAPFIFLYASFSPYPNEAIVIPLAFLGVRLRTLVAPLFFGSLLYNTILVLGIANVIEFLKM